MPGLIACNRRWEIGSDDVFLPAIAEIILFAPWLLASVVLHFFHLEQLQCPDSKTTQTYLLGTDVFLAIVIIVDSVTAFISTQGTVSDEKPRKHLPKLIYFRFALVLPEIGWNVLGTLSAFIWESSFCGVSQYILFVRVTTVYGWVVIALKIFLVFLVYDPLGSPKYRNASYGNGDIEKNQQQCVDWSDPLAKKKVEMWKYRTKLLCYCCCCFVHRDDNTEDAMQNIAEMAAYLWGDCDIVLSDAIAGVKLLKQKNLEEHRKHIYNLEKHPTLGDLIEEESKVTAALSLPSTPPWMTMELACHYMKFTRGIFGWPLLMYTNFSSSICQMWKHLTCCFCVRKPPHIRDDNCCKCNTAALLRMSEIPYSDLVYASFHDSVYETPFYVALDHQTSSVVIVVRGSMSIHDIITDIAGGFDQMCVEGCPKDTWCHHGMFQTALYVKREMESRSILQNVFSKHPDYIPVFTGHSLGAATAILLAFLYRPVYPNLRCYAFGPAACMSSTALKYSEEFVFSLVYGNDMIPTLAVRSGEDIIAQVMDCLAHCDQPKYKILIGSHSSSKKEPSSSFPTSSSLTQGCDSQQSVTPSLSKSSDLNSLKLSSEDTVSSFKPFPSLQVAAPQLYPPGKLLHIGVTPSGFRLRWISSDFYKRMGYRPRMIRDHFPHLMQDVLLQFNNNPSLQQSCTVLSTS